MDRPTCPTCGMTNVQRRTGKRGPYLAVVETYDSGRSYFRRLHTAEECATVIAEREARVAEQIAKDEKYAADLAKGKRAETLIPRYKAIHGAEALATNWTAVAARWLPTY